MTDNPVDDARSRVRNALGEKLAQKATDGFCLAVDRNGPSMASLESMTSSPVAQPAILEFEPPHLPTHVDDHDTWKSVDAAVGEMQQPSRALRLGASTLRRQARIAEARQQTYRVVGNVYEAIERMNGGVLRPGRDVLGAPEIPTLATQVCWLNNTVRTWSDPRVLADVAADDSVLSVDVPIRISPESVDLPTAELVGAPAFREERGCAGEGIIVAVIESEVARGHPAFGDRVVHRRNYTAENWGRPHSHGTAVAGIVGSGDPEFLGIAPEVTIYNYKVIVTDPIGNADNFAGTIALQQAVEDGAHVANCSWGMGALGNRANARAFNTAWAAGVVVVKSAGNRGPLVPSLTSPGDADGVIVVGATDNQGTSVPPYSSRGPVGSGARPHLVAPGGSPDAPIESLMVQGGCGATEYGTSFAAPHVSGLAALIEDQSPDLTPAEVRDALLSHCEPLDDVSEEAQGAGLLRL